MLLSRQTAAAAAATASAAAIRRAVATIVLMLTSSSWSTLAAEAAVATLLISFDKIHICHFITDGCCEVGRGRQVAVDVADWCHILLKRTAMTI